MADTFREIDPESVADNAFKLIGKDTMLVTAGDAASFNTMTAAWGGLGVLWGKNVCYSVIRPTRHTYEFLERFPTYTLSFFAPEHKEILAFCGTRSGRDVDKVKETGLIPVVDDGPVYFAQARLVFQCRKVYYQDMLPGNFLDAEIEKFYPQKDYHRMYVGEVLRCLMR